MKIPILKPKKVGGEFFKINRHFINADPQLKPGKRVEEHKWFLVRLFHNPTKRIRVKMEIDHNHNEGIIWCSCGYRRHNKRGYIADESQKDYKGYTGQS